jgi:uncharacterized membrane protein
MQTPADTAPAHSGNGGMSTHRLEALTDGIYAIAMTLLVLNIDVPSVSQGTAAEALPSFLLSNWPQFTNYAIAFVVLAGFWTVHHKQFHSIRYLNGGMLWLNVLSLLFVALVPFTTSLAGDYHWVLLSSIIFDVNFLIIGMIYVLQWVYVSRDRERFLHEVDPRRIAVGMRRVLVLPVASLCALGIAVFIDPAYNGFGYLVIPVLLALLRR